MSYQETAAVSRPAAGDDPTPRDAPAPAAKDARATSRPPVSERRREAARRNLEKARAAPRSLIYRSTERRTAACRHNLLKAVEWHRTARTPNYAPGFRRGHAVADIERSLELAGETQSDYDAHRKLFQQAFQPRDHGEENVVEGAAQAVWRRLRLLRTHQMAELMRIGVLLASLQTGTLSARRKRFLQEVQAVFERRSLEVWPPMRKLHQRIERLLRVLVEPETGEFRYGVRHDARMEAELPTWPPEAMGNPWIGPGEFEERQGPACVPPVEEWREWGTGADSRGAEAWGEVFRASATLPDAEYAERRAVRDEEQQRGRSPLPQNLEEFTKLMELALGESEDVRKLAELTWERVTLFSRRAEQEREELEALLTAAATELEAEARRELAVKVLSLLVEGEKTLEEAEELEQRIERAAGDLKAGRPVDITPPTPDERLAAKSVNQLIGMLLEAELEELLGKQRSRVEQQEAIRRQEQEKRE